MYIFFVLKVYGLTATIERKKAIYSLISGGNEVGGGGGQPLLASVGTRGVTGENGTMSKMSVDCGFREILPPCIQSRWKWLDHGQNPLNYTAALAPKQKKGAEKSKIQTKEGDKKRQQEGSLEEERVFTRGRGMLHPSEGLGGGRAGFAGGGVSSPADKLDSGELIGVSVTEEISRQESDLML